MCLYDLSSRVNEPRNFKRITSSPLTDLIDGGASTWSTRVTKTLFNKTKIGECVDEKMRFLTATNQLSSTSFFLLLCVVAQIYPHRIISMTKENIAKICKKNDLYITPHLNDVLYLHYQGKFLSTHFVQCICEMKIQSPENEDWSVSWMFTHYRLSKNRKPWWVHKCEVFMARM